MEWIRLNPGVMTVDIFKEDWALMIEEFNAHHA